MNKQEAPKEYIPIEWVDEFIIALVNRLVEILCKNKEKEQ